MEGQSGQAANSSDFVGCMAWQILHHDTMLTTSSGSQAVQVNTPLSACSLPLCGTNPLCDRMLENPQDESVVRWGNEGDSFVVLEVRSISPMGTTEGRGVCDVWRLSVFSTGPCHLMRKRPLHRLLMSVRPRGTTELMPWNDGNLSETSCCALSQGQTLPSKGSLRI